MARDSIAIGPPVKFKCKDPGAEILGPPLVGFGRPAHGPESVSFRIGPAPHFYRPGMYRPESRRGMWLYALQPSPYYPSRAGVDSENGGDL
jgi:hypothetical protein